MKNGTRFNKLVLVVNTPARDKSDTRGQADDPAAYFPYLSSSEDAANATESSLTVNKTILVFLAISATCAAASIASGSYAVWLARHQAARQAITDVNDILKSCQTRMSQLEADIQRLPNRQV